MKIGVCIIFNDMLSMEKKIRRLQEEAFDNCQLISWQPALWTAENAAVLRELFARYGIEISAFWCGWEGPCYWNFYEGQKTLGLVPPQYREARVKNLCDGADFACKLGVKNVVTHMGYIPENPYDPEFEPFCRAVRRVADHLKQNGQYLLFETGQETPVTMLRCFEEVGCDNLGINLDTANLITYGKGNPVDALEVLGAYVANLHAKDGLFPENGHECGRDVPLGEGMVDFERLFRKLKELHYDSYVTIECEMAEQDSPQQMQDIYHAREYLKRILKLVWSD